MCSWLCNGLGIPKGFNHIENHEKLIGDFETMIPKAAETGIPNLICFSGNREGQNDNEGLIIVPEDCES